MLASHLVRISRFGVVHPAQKLVKTLSITFSRKPLVSFGK
jgi:hypothetical protein